MFIQRVSAESIIASGTGNTAQTTITVPTSFIPAAGCVYDVLINAQVPVGTTGTILSITNGTITANVYQCTGNYARCRALEWRKVLRVQFFDDPAHFNILGIRG